MEYTLEELSPIKRKVHVTVDAEEVDAAISATIALYRGGIDIKGFRKGKVPSSIVEAKYKKQIYGEATTDLINYHINEIMNELNLAPLSRIDVDAKEMERGTPFTYSFTFEVAPPIDLPEYKGLEVEEEEVVADEAAINQVIDRLRDRMSQMVVVKEERQPADGEVVIIDFQAFQDGEKLEGIGASKFEMPLGTGGALPQFEELVRSLTPGSSTEGEVTFPEDFLNEDLAGKTVTMRVELHAIKRKELPSLDDDFATQLGYESVDDLRSNIEKAYLETRKDLVRGDAQKKLLDRIKSQVDFQLPESLVEEDIDSRLADLRRKLEAQGKSFASLGKTPEELRAELRPAAEDAVKSSLVLLAIAQAEALTVEPAEVDVVLQKMAIATGQDFHALKDHYEQHNLMIPLKDRVLADKAMDLVYQNAVITKVPPKNEAE
jgi:trigger factor